MLKVNIKENTRLVLHDRVCMELMNVKMERNDYLECYSAIPAW